MTDRSNANPGQMRTAAVRKTGILGRMDSATRLLELLTLLNARPSWRSDELAQRLGVTARTVRRDITRLRDLDYPIDATPGPHGHYRMGRGTQLPPLVLDDQEALAVALGLRMTAFSSTDGIEDAAVSAFAKLERVLPDRLSAQLRDVHEATIAVAPGRAIVAAPDQLLLLAQACRRRERLRFVYTASDGARSLRHADPYRLVQAARRWYLVAHDVDRDAWRTFRLDRLTAAVATGEPCAPHDEPDAAEVVRDGITSRAYPLEATVRLSLPHDEAAAIMPGFVALEPDGDRATVMRLRGSGAAWIVSYLASLPCRVEVIDPIEVRDAFGAHVRTLVGGQLPAG